MDEFELELLRETYPCVKCGWCCTKGVCGYGEWDPERERCRYLTHDNLCEKRDPIVERELALKYPTFWGGCDVPLGNAKRGEKIRADAKRERGEEEREKGRGEEAWEE